MEYSVDQIEPGKVIRIEYRLGFRIQPRVNVLFRNVVEDMVKRKEIDITSQYESLNKS
jgi:KUP system potassium uptake protein